jgi:hypothetical protein
MKTLNLIPAMLATLALLTSATHGQTDSDASKPVIEARCQYTADAACAGDNSNRASDDRSSTVAQMPRRSPGPPMRSGRYPRAYPSYPPPWTGDGHRTAIGALIGLGVGATIGAALPSHPQSGTRVLGGLIFGGLGACFGAALANPIFAFHAHNRHPAFPSTRPEDQDELASRQLKSPTTQSSHEVAPADDPHPASTHTGP